MRGRVKWWNDSKGYGFISVGDKDVFCHYTQILGDGFKTLKNDAEVEFDLYDSGKGLEAKNVRKED